MTMLRPKKVRQHRLSTVRAKNRIVHLLLRQQRRTPKLALTTPVIAKTLGYSGTRTWRLLDMLYDENTVDRSPSTDERPVRFLRDSITTRTYFLRRPALNAFLEHVSGLTRFVLSHPIALQVLGCSLDDIRRLSNLGADLKRYNRYIITLRRRNITRDLPLLQWRRKAVRWWLR
jgi:hypothetical protein